MKAAIAPRVSHLIHRRDRSARSLDWLNLSVAGLQTGFGPFVPVYLASAGWNAREIGFALSIGAISGIVSQVPAGAVVDRINAKRLVLAAGLVIIGLTALFMAFFPTRLVVWTSEVLHGFAGVAVNMAIAAISLTVVGHGAFGERAGQNTRFAAIGAAGSAALLGSTVWLLGSTGPLLMTAALTVPTLAFMLLIPRRALRESPHARHHAAVRTRRMRKQEGRRTRSTFTERGLLAFAACAGLFSLSNGALLPFALTELQPTLSPAMQGFVTSASVIIPQAVAAAVAPWMGRLAQTRGRRTVLLIGFGALPIRGLLLAVVPGPYPLLAAQSLDGLSASVLGLMVPLIAADTTQRHGALNVAMGAFGLSIGVGAAVSTALAGIVATALGMRTALLLLAACGAAAAALLWLVMPETRPEGEPALLDAAAA